MDSPPTVALYRTRRYSVLSRLVDVFVPGRMCMFGEHSDWCASFSGVDGKAIVFSTETGLHARCWAVQDKKQRLQFRSAGHHHLHDVAIDVEWLRAQAAEPGNFFAYVDGTAAEFFTRYPCAVDLTVHIDNYLTTLPMKKGLSSSAAVCVLTVRCLSILMFGFRLSPEEEMDIAYCGERHTPSLCGRLDQVCAHLDSKQVAVIRFCRSSSGDILVNVEYFVNLKKPVWIVIVCLPGSKDTIKILSSLQRAASEGDVNVLDIFGATNEAVVDEVVQALKEGDVDALGKFATAVQERFDKVAVPICPTELTAPNLHNILRDPTVMRLASGGKSVGAGGDGTAELMARSADAQFELIKYLQTLNMEAWSIVLE